MRTNSDIPSKNPATCGIFYLKTLLCIATIAACFGAYAQPRLQVADAKKSFGFVTKGELVKLDYDITNSGNEPLIISGIEISCSCTTVDFPKQPLLPGQGAKITVKFDTAPTYDRQDRVVYINSNDPKGPVKLRYKGFVKRK